MQETHLPAIWSFVFGTFTSFENVFIEDTLSAPENPGFLSRDSTSLYSSLSKSPSWESSFLESLSTSHFFQCHIRHCCQTFLLFSFFYFLFLLFFFFQLIFCFSSSFSHYLLFLWDFFQSFFCPFSFLVFFPLFLFLFSNVLLFQFLQFC